MPDCQPTALLHIFLEVLIILVKLIPGSRPVAAPVKPMGFKQFYTQVIGLYLVVVTFGAVQVGGSTGRLNMDIAIVLHQVVWVVQRVDIHRQSPAVHRYFVCTGDSAVVEA